MTKSSPRQSSGIKHGSRTYFTAFLKQDKETFYVCGGTIVQTPENKDRQVYKVKIDEVSLTPIGKKEENNSQAALLGRIITKKFTELSKEPNEFMRPKAWIKIVRDSK